MLYRKEYVEKLSSYNDMDIIKVITGIRGTGKTELLKQLQEYYKSQGISSDLMLYYDFEAYQSFGLLDAKSLYAHIKKEVGNKSGKCYLFFDEIQNVKNWQKCINSIHVDIACDIYITGSTANILSGDLTGRFVEVKVYPFSFKELQSAKQEQGIEKENKVLFQEYIQYGGMPRVCYTKDPAAFKDYMCGIYANVILNDILKMNAVRYPLILERVLYYVFDNTGHVISASSIAKYLKNEQIKVSIDTVISYLKMATDALLFVRIPRGDAIGKTLLKTQEKYYISDHGFKQYVFNSNLRDIELVLENIVCIELLRRGYEVFVGEVMKKEVDFVCKRGAECLYIQVSYVMPDISTRNREFASLLLINDNYPKLVLSMDEIDFSQKGIQHKNIIDYLLEESKE